MTFQLNARQKHTNENITFHSVEPTDFIKSIQTLKIERPQMTDSFIRWKFICPIKGKCSVLYCRRWLQWP